MTMLQHGLVPSTGGYQIERSLRFNSADSAYLSRTPGSAGNQQKWTINTWVKRSKLSTTQTIIRVSGVPFVMLNFESDDALGISFYTGVEYYTKTSQVFRDVSAWGMLTVAVDTTQATASNRLKIYWNGVQITAFSSATYPPQNLNSAINTTAIHYIGGNVPSSNQYSDYYLADFYLIDGSQLDPSSFGENDTDTGVWKPKAYTGSYGTNGFKLTFSDNSGTTSTTLGKDTSGNGNNWTPNNFSVTAGAGNDSLVDTPTPYGTDTGAGGEVRGNYCTANPLDKSSDVTLSNGNLDIVGTGGAWRSARSTFGISSGKWYWEVLCNSISGSLDRALLGIMKSSANINGYVGSDADGWGYYSNDGNKYTNSTATSYGASYTTGAVIGIAFDADAGTLVFYRNGTSQGTAFTNLLSGPYFPAIGMYGGSVSVNFGQRPFAYTAPSGFKALCTTNLPTPTIGATSSTRAGKYFNTVLYTGTGSDPLAVTGVGFQPDFTWIKARSSAYSHGVNDAVRGAGKTLVTNATDSEYNYGIYFKSFDSDGFTVGQASNLFNTNGTTYAAWNWKANGAGSSNTAGSITSTVSANTTAGFSIVTWTGNATQGATVGHGLGAVPALLIFKNRSVASTEWPVKTNQLATNAYLYLNATNASASYSFFWSADPTSSLIYLGSDNRTNGSGNSMVCYAFAPVAGYSAFGSYTGNGSADGPFVYTGFRPAYIMWKRTDSTSDWAIEDLKRDPVNVTTNYLSANLSSAEVTDPPFMDFLSNGFKIRRSTLGTNASGGTYIYMALAENPFKYSLAR